MELTFTDGQLLDCVRYWLERDAQSVVIDMFAGLLKEIAQLQRRIEALQKGK